MRGEVGARCRLGGDISAPSIQPDQREDCSQQKGRRVAPAAVSARVFDQRRAVLTIHRMNRAAYNLALYRCTGQLPAGTPGGIIPPQPSK